MVEHIRRERRRYPRLYAVVADYKKTARGPVKASQVKNISAVGICIIVYEDIAIGSDLELKIYLPDYPYPILAKGKVIWTKKFRIEAESRTRFDVGIEFTEIKELDKEVIAYYVSSRMKPKE